MDQKSSFHKELKLLMDEFVHVVYDCSIMFPKEEIYGVTSQLRRAALSIILNYIEGYARQKDKVYRNFLEISYGSLKETKYLLYFSYKRHYIEKEMYDKTIVKADRIGKMLWGVLKKM